MTERFRRVDVGHMDVEVTYTDAGTFKTPLTITQKLRLFPDQELIEFLLRQRKGPAALRHDEVIHVEMPLARDEYFRGAVAFTGLASARNEMPAS